MKFYKFNLRSGHVGIGRYQELTIYDFGESYMKIANRVRNLPMVKHNISRAFLNSTEIDEYEYVIGIIQNSYNNIYHSNNSNIDYGYIAELHYVVKRIAGLKNYQFETKEGKRLQEFCGQYVQATDDLKDKIETKYKQWANQMIDDYEQEKYGTPKW